MKFQHIPGFTGWKTPEGISFMSEKPKTFGPGSGATEPPIWQDFLPRLRDSSNRPTQFIGNWPPTRLKPFCAKMSFSGFSSHALIFSTPSLKPIRFLPIDPPKEALRFICCFGEKMRPQTLECSERSKAFTARCGLTPLSCDGSGPTCVTTPNGPSPCRESPHQKLIESTGPMTSIVPDDAGCFWKDF